MQLSAQVREEEVDSMVTAVDEVYTVELVQFASCVNFFVGSYIAVRAIDASLLQLEWLEWTEGWAFSPAPWTATIVFFQCWMGCLLSAVKFSKYRTAQLRSSYGDV